MIIYAVALFLLIAIYPLFFQNKGVLNHKRYIYIVSFMLTIIAGLRSVSVGMDTENYSVMFSWAQQVSFAMLIAGSETEPGYKLFQGIISTIFGEFQILLIVVAIIYVGLVSRLIYKCSDNPLISYILFIGLGLYTFSLSTIRQSIAMAILLIAFEYIKEKKIWKFLASVALATTFHLSALIFLPNYFLAYFKFNKKTMLALATMIACLIGLQDEVREILISNARIKYTQEETGGAGMSLFMASSLLLGIIYRKEFIRKNEYNVYLFYMLVAAAVIFQISQIHPAVMRLYLYDFIFIIIYIPNLFSVINNPLVRFIGLSAYSLTALVWFFTAVIKAAELEEYRFFWE